MDEVAYRVLEEVKEELENGNGDSGHDVHHAERVYRMGMRIAGEEGGDTEVIGAACLAHDIHRGMGDGGFVSPRESLPRVRQVLQRADYPAPKIPEVLYCVEVHEDYGFEENYEEPETLEAEIVQDADNLDAMGAIGIARAFVFSGARDSPMWEPEKEFVREHYVKDDLGDSTIHHLQDKVLRLKDDLNTPTARKIAEGRHDYVQGFVDRFRKEWRGEL